MPWVLPPDQETVLFAGVSIVEPIESNAIFSRGMRVQLSVKDGAQKPGLAGFDGVEIQYSVAKWTGKFTVSGPKASSRRRRPKRKMRGVPNIFAVQELLASQSPVACGFISRSCKGRLKGSETLKPNCKSSKGPSNSVAGA